MPSETQCGLSRAPTVLGMRRSAEAEPAVVPNGRLAVVRGLRMRRSSWTCRTTTTASVARWNWVDASVLELLTWMYRLSVATDLGRCPLLLMSQAKGEICVVRGVHPRARPVSSQPAVHCPCRDRQVSVQYDIQYPCCGQQVSAVLTIKWLPRRGRRVSGVLAIKL